MITPATYGNALKYLNNSSNQSSGYMTGQSGLSGSNISSRRVVSGYGNFDLTTAARMGAISSIFVGMWGLSRAAFPARSDWRWIAVPT